jgi:hypothetical protein
MLEWGTWLAVAALGPGAIALFLWFLKDVREVFRDRDD